MAISDSVVKAAEALGPLKASLQEVEKQLSEVTDKYEATEDEDEQNALIETIADLTNQKHDLVPKVKVAQTKLDTLKSLEQDMAKKAQPVTNVPSVIKKRGDLKPDHKPGDMIVQMGLVKAIAKLSETPEDVVLKDRYGEDNDELRGVMDWAKKTAVAPASTTVTGWAAELVATEMRGFLDMITNVSIGAALATRGMMLNFGGAGSVTVPRMNQIPSTTTEPAWVGEGGVIPLTQFSFGSTTLNRYKLASIVPMTMELVRTATRDAEAIMRRGMQEQYAVLLDGALLSSSGAVAGVRPAGLLNGVAATAATAAGGYAAVLGDIQSILTAFANAGIGQDPVLIMHDQDYVKLGMLVNPLGQLVFRDGLGAGNLMGIPVIHSRNAIQGTLVAIDAANLATAFDGPEFSVSETATITEANADGVASTQADDGAGAIGTPREVPPNAGIPVSGDGVPVGAAGAGYTARSLWQTWSVGLRAVWPTSYALMRPSSVVRIDNITW